MVVRRAVTEIGDHLMTRVSDDGRAREVCLRINLQGKMHMRDGPRVSPPLLSPAHHDPASARFAWGTERLGLIASTVPKVQSDNCQLVPGPPNR